MIFLVGVGSVTGMELDGGRQGVDWASEDGMTLPVNASYGRNGFSEPYCKPLLQPYCAPLRRPGSLKRGEPLCAAVGEVRGVGMGTVRGPVMGFGGTAEQQVKVPEIKVPEKKVGKEAAQMQGVLEKESVSGPVFLDDHPCVGQGGRGSGRSGLGVGVSGVRVGGGGGTA